MLSTLPDTSPNSGNPYCDWLWGHGAAFSPARRILESNPYPGALDVDLAATNLPPMRLIRPGQGNPSPVAPNDPPRGSNVRYPLPLLASSLPAGGPNDPIAIPAAAAGALGHLNALTTAERDQLVIVGVIDDAVNVAHQRFIGVDGKTRVDFAWVQDGKADGRVPFGKEIRAAEIDAAIDATSDPAQQVKQLGLVDMNEPGWNLLWRRLSHGTHVADLATGYGADDNSTDPNEIAFSQTRSVRIVTVHMPHAMVLDTAGGFTLPFVSLAVDYILQRASEIKAALGLTKSLPVIINLSDAISSGPRDGTGVLEARLKKQLDDGKSLGLEPHLVLPVGNRFLDRGHAVLDSSSVGNPLPWRIQPGDPSSNYLEIWYPQGQTPSIEITPPGGAAQAVTAADPSQQLHWKGNQIGRVSFDAPPDGTRRRALIALAPTEIHGSNSQRTPAGVWEIRISNVSLTGSEPALSQIDAWIQRDDLPYSYGTAGRQSYFDDPAYQRYRKDGYPEAEDITSVVKRKGTVSGIATANTGISGGTVMTVVGGIRGNGRHRDGSDRAPSSAEGANGKGPDISAVSERSAVLPGILAAGSMTGSTVAQNGTSVAAPQITRELANRTAKHGLTVDAARTQLIAGAIPVKEPTPVPLALRPNESTSRVGAGERLQKPEHALRK